MTQNAQIRQALESGAILTPLVALQQFGCFRLSERIRECERGGLVVEHERVKLDSGKSVMSYRLLRFAVG